MKDKKGTTIVNTFKKVLSDSNRKPNKIWVDQGSENENENNYKSSSCPMYIVLMIVVCTIFTGITIYFIYYNWFLIKKNVCCIKFGIPKETKIW